MNHQSKNNQDQQERLLAEHLAKHEDEKRKSVAGRFLALFYLRFQPPAAGFSLPRLSEY